MKIVVQGLWHLGAVTAACLADAGFDTTGLDSDSVTVERLKNAHPPLHEPGLPDLVAKGLATGRLSFSTNKALAEEADLVWVAFDTPVDEEDRADAAFVERQVEGLFPHLKDGSVVLISAQLPVGTTRALAARFAAVSGGRRIKFAYSPENLRLGKAIEAFTRPDRIIVGTEDRQPSATLQTVLNRFSDALIWMSIESAEMVKHAINAFLATSVTFINEIAVICESVGAQASDVEEALRSEPRIGRKAYLKPGAAFAGGTLARDVVFLGQLAQAHGITAPLIGSIIASNAAHRRWPLRRVCERFNGDLRGRAVAVLGLSYKPGTDALRRSASIELCRDLIKSGARVQAFDPVVKTLPPDLAPGVKLGSSVDEALEGTEAAVLATEWPEFRAIAPSAFTERMRDAFVVDQNGFLSDLAQARSGVAYAALGRG
jgi:UDPglucose 6-dehydrogenase